MRSTLAAERAPEGELALVFVSREAMRRINRDYRGIDRPTDVLAFSYLDEPCSGGVLGEIFISAEVASEQAAETGISAGEEIARLAVHGALHVLGFDHDTPSSRRRMLSRQERYLTRHLNSSASCP
jgi:probable rRNA maturation factor